MPHVDRNSKVVWNLAVVSFTFIGLFGTIMFVALNPGHMVPITLLTIGLGGTSLFCLSFCLWFWAADRVERHK